MNAGPHPCPSAAACTQGGERLGEGEAARGHRSRPTARDNSASLVNVLACQQAKALVVLMQAFVYWCCVWRAAAGEASKGGWSHSKGGEVGLPGQKSRGQAPLLLCHAYMKQRYRHVVLVGVEWPQLVRDSQCLAFSLSHTDLLLSSCLAE